MIKPMTKEDTQRALERSKANRFDEYGNYGENNGPVPESKPEGTDYLSFVESMILTYGRDRLAENTLGLVGEAGEVAEKIKKFFRDNTLDEEHTSRRSHPLAPSGYLLGGHFGGWRLYDE